MNEQNRKGELEAAQQTKFFEALLRASGDGIVITDTAQNIVVANDAFCAFFDRPWRDVVETNLFVWLEQLDADAPHRWTELEQRVRLEGACRDIEFRLATKDGARYFSVNASLLEQAADEELGVIVSIWQDVTGRKQVEETLRESERRYKQLSNELESMLDHLPALVFYKDKKGNFIRVNKYVANAHHVPKEALEGKSTFELYPEEQAQAYLEDDLRVIESGKPVLFIEELWETAEGKSWVSTSKIPFVDEKGDVLGIIGISIDITEHKRVEEALRESEEKHRSFMETASDLMHIADKDGYLTYVNASMARILGYSQEEMIGMHITRVVSEETLKTLEPGLEELMTRGEISLEPIWVTKDGEEIHGEVRVVATYDSNSQFAGSRGVIRDITERKRAEEEAQRRAAQAALVYDVGRRVSGELELDALLSEIVTAVRDAFGYYSVLLGLLDEESGDLVLRSAAGAYTDDLLDGLRVAGGEGMTGHAVATGETQVSGDVSQYPHYVREELEETRSELAAPIKIGQKVIGVLDIQSDEPDAFDESDVIAMETLGTQIAIAIENARLYEEIQQERASLAQRVAERTAELSAANIELVRAARLKNEFLAAMSHELRTPLNAILGMSEVLRREIYGPLDERQHQSVRIIEEGGRYLLDLINDILDVAKIETGKVELQIGPVSIESVCQASLRFIKQPAHKKQIEVSSSFDSAVTMLQADERRLKQILVNLLNNAIKFTPKGGAVGLEVLGDAEQGTVRFSVWDTGIGISEQDMERLFQPFVQLDSSLSRQYAGTGLGLALVHSLTEMQGGSVSVESEVGKGSRFTVSLPWQPVEESTSVGVWERERGAPAPAPKPPASHRSATILLAEDNLPTIEAMCSLLSAEGYQVIQARDGEEAIERAREERPDLILMDIQMPGMGGLEAIRRIRADAEPGVAAIPIVALTALAMRDDQNLCLAAGADAYLSKPFDFDELLEMIETQLEQEGFGI